MNPMIALAGIMVALLTNLNTDITGEPFPRWVAPGRNVARGRPYEVKTAGKSLDYHLTKDTGDKVQLTDGVLVPREKHMWWYKEAFGRFMGTVGITIDLGQRRAIGGVGYSTDSGAFAGVNFPPAILILVSDDGKAFRVAGELIGLATKFGPPPATDRYWIRTDDLKTSGRYVQLVVQSAMFVFSDEIEIYEGKAEYLNQTPKGAVITDAPKYLRDNIMTYAVPARLAADAARARVTLETIKAPAAQRQQIAAKLEQLRQAALHPDRAKYDADFHAIVPLNAAHARVFAALSPALRAAGYPEFFTWNVNRWARQTPFDLPKGSVNDVSKSAELRVRLMQNDRRGEVLNISNYGAAARMAHVSIAGLPGGAKPKYLTLRQAEYVAMQARPWDADVLPAAEAKSDGWRVSLPAGISRQLWLDFLIKPGTCPPGTHKGEVLVKIDGGPELRVPLMLTVAPTALPDDKAVLVGNWDYTHGGSRKLPDVRYQPYSGVQESNTDAAVAHMRASGVSVAWAITQWSIKDVVPFWNSKLKFDADHRMISSPDYTTFDNWVKLRSEVRYYAVYCTAAPNWRGTKQGTAAFKQQMAAVVKDWVAHMRKLGVDPSRIVLCMVDEPTHSGTATTIIEWTEAIRAAEPKFRFYVNPMVPSDRYKVPQIQRMLETADIITPGTDYSYHKYGQAAVDFYESARAKGKIMGFYACAQNPGEADAIRYYRLQQWACWKINKGGRQSWCGFWAYGDTRSNSPWNQLPCGNDRNFSPVYIDSRSVTDGKHWLAIFEGVNDYEYLLMLKDHIAAARKAGRPLDAIAKAEKLLNELPDRVIAAVRAGQPPIADGKPGSKIRLGDRTACDEARLQILDALMSLDAPAKE